MGVLPQGLEKNASKLLIPLTAGRHQSEDFDGKILNLGKISAEQKRSEVCSGRNLLKRERKLVAGVGLEPTTLEL